MHQPWTQCINLAYSCQCQIAFVVFGDGAPSNARRRRGRLNIILRRGACHAMSRSCVLSCIIICMMYCIIICMMSCVIISCHVFLVMHDVMCHCIMLSRVILSCHVIMIIHAVTCHSIMHDVMCHNIIHAITCHSIMHDVMCHYIMSCHLCHGDTSCHIISCHVMHDVTCHSIMHVVFMSCVVQFYGMHACMMLRRRQDRQAPQTKSQRSTRRTSESFGQVHCHRGSAAFFN